MPRPITYLLTLLLTVVALVSYGQKKVTNAGTDFWLAFTEVHDNVTSVFQVNISSAVATSGNVSIPGTGFSSNYTVTPGVVTKVTIPSADAHISGSETIRDRGIHVTSLDDIVVYANSYHLYRSEASLVLPTPSLGREYRIISYPTQNSSGLKQSEFTVVATDTVTVDITTTANTAGGNTPGVPWSVTLNPGQIYQVQAAAIGDDLTGSLIKGKNPTDKFAVFAGHVWAHVSCTGNKDPLYEASFPVSTWGKEYLVMRSPNKAWDEYRVLAAEDSTIVLVNGNPVDTLDAGEFYSDTTVSRVFVTSPKPISVTQFMITGQCDGYTDSDPMMININPMEQMFLDTITFYTIDKNAIDSNYVHIICRVGDTSDMWLNGAQVTGFTRSANAPDYAWRTERIPIGSHTIRTSTCGFLAYVMGIGYAESYGYAAGVFLRDLSEDLHFSNVNSENSVICVGDTIQFLSTTSEQAESFFWQFGDGDTTSIKDPKHVYQDSGVYHILLQVDYKCRIDTVLDTLRVFPDPVVELRSDTAFCEGNAIVLDAGTGASHFEWNTGDTTQTIVVSEGGSYSVLVRELNCYSYDEVEIEIYPIPTIPVGDSMVECYGLPLVIEQPGWYTYRWYDGTMGAGNVVRESDDYWVIVSDEHQCVEDTIFTNVYFDDCSDCNHLVYMPNVFTPRDIANNFFYPRSREPIEVRQFQIYNRWGEVIYQAADFETNDVAFAWDGTHKGADLPPQVFAYMIEVVCKDGEHFFKKGNITLLK